MAGSSKFNAEAFFKPNEFYPKCMNPKGVKSMILFSEDSAPMLREARG